MDPPCSYLLQRIMANVSELDGQLYSRNLTNVGVDVLKYILQEKGGFKNIQIQQEAKSTNAPFSAGSKVAYIMEDEEWKHSCWGDTWFLCLEVSLIIYFVIGETDSVGFQHLEVQLAIGMLGSLLKLKKKKNRSSSFPQKPNCKPIYWRMHMETWSGKGSIPTFRTSVWI